MTDTSLVNMNIRGERGKVQSELQDYFTIANINKSFAVPLELILGQVYILGIQVLSLWRYSI